MGVVHASSEDPQVLIVLKLILWLFANAKLLIDFEQYRLSFQVSKNNLSCTVFNELRCSNLLIYSNEL